MIQIFRKEKKLVRFLGIPRSTKSLSTWEKLRWLNHRNTKWVKIQIKSTQKTAHRCINSHAKMECFLMRKIIAVLSKHTTTSRLVILWIIIVRQSATFKTRPTNIISKRIVSQKQIKILEGLPISIWTKRTYTRAASQQKRSSILNR